MNNSIVVHYNGRSYEISVVDRGVPQGSVLGPLYFVLFTADVFGVADEHGFAIHGYADDMQIYDHLIFFFLVQIALLNVIGEK